MSRIISGRLKGRKIIAPKNLEARPTTDRAKEALFNILRHRISFEETDALDLFGGIGSISFELASRGCPSVITVEWDARSVAFIKTLKEKLEVDEIEIHKIDALRYVKSTFQRFDLIFADPPYAYEHYDELIEEILGRNLLNSNGLLIVEHGQESTLDHLPFYTETREYSRVHFSFFSPSDIL
jgi:16S rRNA (guanine(966)-N(2))-methyltransferase RsmD